MTGDLALVAVSVVMPGVLLLALLAALGMLVVAMARANAVT